MLFTLACFTGLSMYQEVQKKFNLCADVICNCFTSPVNIVLIKCFPTAVVVQKTQRGIENVHENGKTHYLVLQISRQTLEINTLCSILHFSTFYKYSEFSYVNLFTSVVL